MSAALPVGFRLAPDPATERIADALWHGTRSGRLLRMTPAGRDAWRVLATGPVTDRVTGELARKLTDAGLAHPVPPRLDPMPAIAVVIPVRDRPRMLERCLDALGQEHPVVVVDDCSGDPDAVAAVAARPGVSLIRRAVNGGPAAARNTGIESLDTDLIAFLDSDCVAAPGWTDRLAGHFADPTVAAVAPRIVAVDGRSCGLDLGATPALVAPGSAVSFVPTAALVVRRAAVTAIARGRSSGGGSVFDPTMRVGEDVDLVWLLHDAGWRVRYEPAVTVGHHEPPTRKQRWARRYRYGTSAASLAVRHRGCVAPLILSPWPALTVAAALARRPGLAAAAFAVALTTTVDAFDRVGASKRAAAQAITRATYRSWLGIGRYCVQFAAPLLLAALVAPAGDPARALARRTTVVSLLLASLLFDRSDCAGPDRIGDDIAYGTGVLAGCLRHRTLAPITPTLAAAQSRRASS